MRGKFGKFVSKIFKEYFFLRFCAETEKDTDRHKKCNPWKEKKKEQIRKEKKEKEEKERKKNLVQRNWFLHRLTWSNSRFCTGITCFILWLVLKLQRYYQLHTWCYLHNKMHPIRLHSSVMLSSLTGTKGPRNETMLSVWVPNEYWGFLLSVACEIRAR